MKIFRKIAAYLSIALLAFANLGAYGIAEVPPPQRAAQTEQWTASIRLHHDTLFCQTEQKTGPNSQQGGGFLGFKHPLPTGFAKASFLNSPTISGVNYYLVSRHLLIGFETTDAIYPFHQFW